MTHKLARTLLFSLFAALAFGLLGGPAAWTPTSTAAAPWADVTRPQTQHVVLLASKLDREQTLTLAAALSASEHPGVLLIDSGKSTPYHKRFLQAYKPEAVVPVGTFSEDAEKLGERLGVKVATPVEWKAGVPLELWQQLFPKAERVVVCPAKPERLLLQAASLAGSARAPLYVFHGHKAEVKELRRLLSVWHTRTILAVGSAERACPQEAGLEIVKLPTEAAVATESLRRLVARGPIHTLVFANPADVTVGTSAMSSLAPWIASQRHAPLLLTNAKGNNVEELVNAAIKKRDLRRVENLILVADLKAIPMTERPNPIPDGKDPTIEMEPLTPTGSEPFSFATGRLFNDDPSVVALVVARERLLSRERLHEKGRPRKALVVSNALANNDTLGLPLLEAFSRNTVQEFKNCGYETTALFGTAATKDAMRRLLPAQDVFLWEGHHNTLIKEYCMHEWDEPLQPSVIFLQSCLALKDYKCQPIIERGALCVVGSSTRIYSASGGAFALSFFDAMMYENQSAGASLRQAKNFLLAYSLLKEKRLGKDAKLSAANLRSAWAFTLWGDPTLRLPTPPEPEDALPPVQHEVNGNVIQLFLPDATHDKAITAKYKAQMYPNGRIAGLIQREPDEKLHKLVPFVFAEVALPHAPANKTPRLTSKLPERRWVFCWDARRRCGYLLAAPRSKDAEEIRFHVSWDSPEMAADE